jgi:hypothetical protein
MDPCFILESPKSFEEACASRLQAVPDHGFGVLAVHDLGQTLRSKALAFPGECRIFEVCNPLQAAAALATTMALNMALPCRIGDAGGLVQRSVPAGDGPGGGSRHHGDHRSGCGLIRIRAAPCGCSS